MKKITYLFLIFIGSLTYAQVIIGADTENSYKSLKKEDLEIQGNLKVEDIENLCKEENGEVVCKNYSQTYLDTKNHNTLVKGNIPKIFQRVVFYIKVGNKDDKIIRFNTKINSKKYAAIISGSSILNSNGKPFKLPEVSNELNAVKEVKLFEYSENNNPDNTTWAFSADYSSVVTPNKIWSVELLLMNKAFVTDIKHADPTTVYDVKKTDRENRTNIGGVGIGTNDPKATLDVKGHLRINNTRDVSGDKILKDRTLPLVADVSKKDKGDNADSWGMLKATANTKIAYPINLRINMNGSDGDFVYYLRLGLDPKKYIPVLANYQLTCKDNNTKLGINFKKSRSQPTPNNYITKWEKTNDWALYLDYDSGSTLGCENNTIWDAFLLVFRNENIVDIPIYLSNGQINDKSNPIVIWDNYESNENGYYGSVSKSPLP